MTGGNHGIGRVLDYQADPEHAGAGTLESFNFEICGLVCGRGPTACASCSMISAFSAVSAFLFR